MSKESISPTKPLTLDEKTALVLGHIRMLHDQVLRYTGKGPVAVAMHPEYCPELPFDSVFGLPVIRTQHVPKTHPCIVWGHE